MFFESIVEALELQARVLADTVPSGPIDAVLLFGETTDNEGSTLETVGEIATIAGKIVYSTGSKLLTGEAWSPEYGARLIALGVPVQKIMTADLSAFPLAHTHTEAIAFAQMAKAEGWKTVCVVAATFHAPASLRRDGDHRFNDLP